MFEEECYFNKQNLTMLFSREVEKTLRKFGSVRQLKKRAELIRVLCTLFEKSTLGLGIHSNYKNQSDSDFQELESFRFDSLGSSFILIWAFM